MYDCTFYVENDLDVSIAHWLKGQPSTISLVCSRIDLSEIPTDPDESKAYLNQLFHEKVQFNRQGMIPDQQYLINPDTQQFRGVTQFVLLKNLSIFGWVFQDYGQAYDPIFSKNLMKGTSEKGTSE